MEKIKRIKNIWLCAAVLSLASGAAGIICTVIFALNIMYVPLVISILVMAHAAYGTPHYFAAYLNMRLTERAADAVLNQSMTADEAAELLGINPAFCKKLLLKARSKGCISEIQS